jgi:hypothetical protein
LGFIVSVVIVIVTVQSPSIYEIGLRSRKATGWFGLSTRHLLETADAARTLFTDEAADVSDSSGVTSAA